MLIISVIGSGQASQDIWDLAEQVGAELGHRGITVVCGGLGGVMAAVCKGAWSAGGTTIGILPGKDPRDANEWVGIPVCTGIGYARNLIVVRTGSAVIAVGGAYGTLSEIGHALADGIPVVAHNTWAIARGGVEDEAMLIADSLADAVEKATEAARRRAKGFDR